MSPACRRRLIGVGLNPFPAGPAHQPGPPGEPALTPSRPSLEPRRGRSGLPSARLHRALAACPALLRRRGCWRDGNQERTEDGPGLGGNRPRISAAHGAFCLAFKTEGELRQTFTELLRAERSRRGACDPSPAHTRSLPGGRQRTRDQIPDLPAARPPQLMPKSLYL